MRAYPTQYVSPFTEDSPYDEADLTRGRDPWDMCRDIDILSFQESTVPRRIDGIHRVCPGIQILVQSRWLIDITRLRIATHEPASEWVVISGAQVVEAEVGVVLFAAMVAGTTRHCACMKCAGRRRSGRLSRRKRGEDSHHSMMSNDVKGYISFLFGFCRR